MLAYLILEHQSPRQLARLIEALQHPETMFFVHIDAKIEPGQFRYMTRRWKNVTFLPKKKRRFIEWGGWNMVGAELEMLEMAMEAGAQAFVLLSGMDYPVWSNSRLVNYFLSTERSHIEHFSLPCEFWDRDGLNRIHQYWLSDDPISIKSRLYRKTIGRVWRVFWHRLFRKVVNLGMTVLFEMGIRRPYPRDLEPYMGSQWWSMTRAGAESVFQFIKDRPEVLRFYKHSHIPDEGFLQTVLLNSSERDRVDANNLRYIVWDQGFSPRFLEHADLDAILETDAAFIRKVAVGPVKDKKTGATFNSSSLVSTLDELRHEEPDAKSSEQVESKPQAAPVLEES